MFDYFPSLFLQYTSSGIFKKFFPINNFSVDYAVLCINWDITSLFIILGTLLILKLTIQSHPSLRHLFFYDVVLVANCHGCGGQAMK